ncbi:MAG: helix-turn-helix domain-containing protein [Halobacteriales archaeon]|nr:helix-turn-helix domain-containing protein [Halobacteriales archaeon]
MSVVADFTISGDTFQLGRLLTFEDGVSIELERLVPTGNEVMPYFWVAMPDSDFEAFERMVRADPLVSRLNVLDRVGDETLYAIEWKRVPESLIQGIVQTGGAILEGRGAEGHWRFMIRFPDHKCLTEFNEFLTEHDIDIQVDRIYTQTDEHRREYAFDLTDEQREAIVSAVRRGYFEVPRGVTLSDLAEDLGITRQAASERVRRGANAVLSGVLLGGREHTVPEASDDDSR